LNWAKKRIIETDLFINTKEFLRQFGVDPVVVAPALLAVSQDYSFHVAEAARLGTRSDVLITLHELEELQELSAKRRELRLLAVSETAIRSLCGLFPSSMITVEEFGGCSDGFRMIDDLDAIVSAFKSNVAHRSIANVPLVGKVRGDATALAALAREDIARARKALIEWAKQAPASFAEHVRATISTQEETFQVAGQAGGRNVRLDETVTANADWRLIDEVLNILWPIEKGMLHARHRRSLVEILTQTKSFSGVKAVSKRHDPDDRGYIDPNIVSAVLTLRHQINSLNRSLHLLETLRAFLQGRDDFSEIAWKREERLDRVAFYPLLDWRRELQRRLRHGDYRAWNDQIRRATGPVFKVPEMPVFNKRMNLLRRTLMLIHAAGRFRREACDPLNETTGHEIPVPDF
jgi:hypothetical protein